MLPTQDPIIAVSAPKTKSLPLASAAWLRVELESGRRFEIGPMEQYFEDERYPRLAIAIEEVPDFKEIRFWPSGPVLEWVTPKELQPLLGLSVHSGAWLRSSEVEPPEGYETKLSNGTALRVLHSQASPMSVEFTVFSVARSAA
jgi:hypothetical protein